MKRTTRSLVTVGLALAVAGGIGGYAYVTSQGDDKPVVSEDKKLVSVGKITRVEVSGRRTFTLELDGPRWMMMKPYGMVADQNLAGAIPKWLAGESTQIFTEEDMPGDAETGLAEPLFLVRVVGDKGTALMTVGRISTFNRELHVRVEDDRGTRTVLTNSSLIRALDKEPERMLLRDTLGTHPRFLERLEVTPAQGLVVGGVQAVAYKIERTDVVIAIQGVQAERFFVVKEPAVDGPDVETLQRIAGVFSNPITRFIKDDPPSRTKVGLDNPAYRLKYAVKVDDGTLREAEMTISPPEGDFVYITRSDIPFIGEVNKSLFEALAATKEQLETKKVLVLDVTAVQAIELTLGGEQVRAVRTAGGGGIAPGWQMQKPTEARAKTTAVNKMVIAFSMLSGSDRATTGPEVTPAELQKLGLAPGKRREVRFFARGDLSLGEVWIGKQEDGHFYVMRKGGTYVARVPEARLTFLPEGVNELL
jgi:hypothetical protein